MYWSTYTALYSFTAPPVTDTGTDVPAYSSVSEVESSQALSSQLNNLFLFILPQVYMLLSLSLPSQLLLKNGVLITFTVAKHSGDIERISIDRSLVMRLPSNIDAGKGKTVTAINTKFLLVIRVLR